MAICGFYGVCRGFHWEGGVLALAEGKTGKTSPFLEVKRGVVWFAIFVYGGGRSGVLRSSGGTIEMGKAFFVSRDAGRRDSHSTA